MPSIALSKVFAALPFTERGKPVRLAGDPNNKNILYCHGNSVFIRNMEDPIQVDIYTQHAKPTTVARYCPSRFYIASCDSVGTIRIWDTVNAEHILKCKFEVLGGRINDVCWDKDSKRIIVCGNGRNKFGYVFNWDTGTSLGSIEGHADVINTCSFRLVKPFHIVTASEDRSIGFFKGRPYQFEKTQRDMHTNYINVARYSPDGKVILSGSADGKILKFDGETCDYMEDWKIENPAHKMGINELCFSPEGKKVLTVSGDKTAKIFDVETGSLEHEFGNPSSNNWQDMQFGCLWQDKEIITVNGYGHIIYQNPDNPSQPKRVIRGHNKPITSLALSEDRTTIFTGGQEGILYWDIATGNSDYVTGTGHKAEVTDMAIDGDKLMSIGMDDTLRVSSVSSHQFSDVVIGMDSQPHGVDAQDGVVVVACEKNLMVLEGNGKQFSAPLKTEAKCVSIQPGKAMVAVGFADKKVRIYSLQSGQLNEENELATSGEVSYIAFSPNGEYLTFGSERSSITYSTSDYSDYVSKSEPHTARVLCVGWMPDSSGFATAGIDSKVVFWNDVKAEAYKKKADLIAHTMSHANKLVWVDNRTFITVGQDSNIKHFSVSMD